MLLFKHWVYDTIFLLGFVRIWRLYLVFTPGLPFLLHLQIILFRLCGFRFMHRSVQNRTVSETQHFHIISFSSSKKNVQLLQVKRHNRKEVKQVFPSCDTIKMSQSKSLVLACSKNNPNILDLVDYYKSDFQITEWEFCLCFIVACI